MTSQPAQRGTPTTYGDVLAVVRRYWRVLLLGALGALIAYIGSFAVSPTYDSTTRLLVRGRDATFLTTTGRALEDQPGVIDATLAKALGATQSALLSSRRVSEMVVDDLGLDRPRPEEHGVVADFRGVVKGIYKRTRAYLTHGFYAEPAPREAAVDGVLAGLRAKAVEDSYVVELMASADAPDLAAAIANSAADALVTISSERFRADARRYRARLGRQLRRAERRQRAAAESAQAYQRRHRLVDANVESRLTTPSDGSVRRQLMDTEVALRGARAQLDSLSRGLASIPETATDVSRVRTGRGTTQIDSTASSTIYQGLRAEQQRVRAQVASLTAKQEALHVGAGDDEPAGLTGREAELLQLRLRQKAAERDVEQLHARHQEAVVNAANDRAELTRIDRAAAALFPTGPKRYLYLGMGGLAGAAAGLLLSFVSATRARPPAPAGRRTPAPTAPSPPARRLVGGEALAAGEPSWLGQDGAPGRGQLGRFELFVPSAVRDVGASLSEPENRNGGERDGEEER